MGQSWISPTGRLGDTILLNGTRDPYLEISDERVRFRLLNASNARIYIGFADEHKFHLIATDGGPLERPRRLGPRARPSDFLPASATTQTLTRPTCSICHILQHEDRGMMGQFVVVGPGQQPTGPSHERSYDCGPAGVTPLRDRSGRRPLHG